MVRIITDSVADFELCELEKMNVELIPMKVSFGEDEYKETVELSKDKFYELLKGSDEIPKTSQPAPYDIEEAFKKATNDGDEAIMITMSSALSGTYQSMVLIKNMLECEKLYVIDSLNATGGERILVEYAVKLRDEGLGAEEIVKRVEALRGRIVLYACVDTLEYLHKGGRISGAAYTVGTIANIKPIITVSPEGEIKIPAKLIGLRKGMRYLLNKIKEIKPSSDFPIYAMYTHNRKNGEVLAESIEKEGLGKPDDIINVGAAIGTHVGPDACGVVYVREE